MKPVHTLFFLMSATMVLASCGGGKPELEDPDQYRVTVGSESVYTEPVKFEKDFGIHARRDGNKLVISAANNRSDEVHIVYTDLALIRPSAGSPAERKPILISPEKADLRQVVPLVLRSGEQGVMQIPLRNPALMNNARLVYNNPRKNIIFFVGIE